MKAIILARVSSKDQEENNSIPAQVRRLQDYAVKHSLEIVNTYKLVESSTKTNRVQFNEIIKQIKRSKETIALITDTIDRLQRGFRESVMLDELRKEGKVELRFMRENLIINQKSNSADILRWDMGVMFAKSYVTQLSDNVRRGQEEKLRNGEWSGKAHFGYRNVSKGGKAWIEPDDNAPIVQSIFSKYASGAKSISKIREWLQAAHGLKVANSQVEKILKQPFYHGVMRVKGVLYPHRYEPIISKELFDKAQAVGKSYQKVPYKFAGLPYLYRGLMVCGECGCRITPQKAKGRYIYYHCTQFKGKHGAPYVLEEEITKQLHQAIKAIQPSEEQYNEVLSALRESHQDAITFKKQQTSIIQAEMTKIGLRSERLYESYLDGDIDRENYKLRRANYDQQKYSLDKRLNSLDSANQEYYDNAVAIMGLVRNAPLLFEKCSNPDEKAQFLKMLFQNLELNGKQLGWEYKKPYDSMAKCDNITLWRGLVVVFRTHMSEMCQNKIDLSLLSTPLAA